MGYIPFDFSFPTRIIFGCGQRAQAASHTRSLLPGKVMVVSYKEGRLPVLDEYLAALDKAGVSWFLYDACVPNPRAGDVDTGAAAFHAEGCGAVVGVGGGSVIDTAKGIALLAANPAPSGVWGYVSGAVRAAAPAVPLGLIVTIASTGSESNASFVITSNDSRHKLICTDDSVRPVFSVCDPELSRTLPKTQTALGAVDIFSHALEQYLHGDGHVDLSDGLAEGLMRAVVKWAPVACENPGDMDARSNLMLASILAMSRVLGVGHSENWICHMLEHALTAVYNTPHAMGMAGIIPAYLRYVAPGDATGRIARLGSRVFGTAPDAEAAIAAVEGFIAGLGLPCGLKTALPAPPPPEALAEMAAEAMSWGPVAVNGFAPFGEEDARRVLGMAIER